MKTIKQSVALAILSMYLPHVGLVLAASDQIQDTSQQFSRSSKAVADATPSSTPSASASTTHTHKAEEKAEKTAAKAQGNPALPELPVPPLNPSYAWYGADADTKNKVEASVTPTATKPVTAKPAATIEKSPPTATPVAPTIVATPTVAPTAPAGPMLQNVDFRREADGGARLVVTLPSADTKVSDEKRGNTITLSLANVDTPADLQKHMDVTDFGTPISEVDIAQRDLGSRINLTGHEGFDYHTQRNGNEFTVYIEKHKTTPEEKLDITQKQKKNFTGDKLSLNFQDIEVRAVLQLLADFTNKNIVVSDSVQGNITVRLKDVPWDQALDIVLESKNLAMRENGNVIWVAPSAELEAKDKQTLEALKAKQELEPLVTEYVAINFAKAADIAALIEKSKDSDKDSKRSLLSARGKVSVDERTNTLLIQETASQVKEIRDLIKALDIPIQQVLIESRIVTATDTFGKELGAKFGVTPMWANNGSTGIATGNLGTTTDDYFTSIATAANDSTGKTLIKIPGLSDRLSVNLPVTGAAGSFGFSVLTKDFLVDLELSALQAESRGEIISTPKVITSNQTKALIEQGVEIPYQQASSSGATNVAFKKAVLSMEVTPQITPDEHILMDLKVNQDTVGTVYSGIPSINTREIQTKVMVDNGQTIVLGGVHEEENLNGTTKVPVLGDVPVLGQLFRTDKKSNDKRELMIFVTPKIVDGKS